MDYEATDAYYSRGAVTCVHNGTRFWIADDPANVATAIPERARRYRSIADAEQAAKTERSDYAWRGAFNWQAVPYFTIFNS
jgi:hypothetical protein